MKELIDDNRGDGALPTAHATHEQSQQAVSAVPVGIANSVESRALAWAKRHMAPGQFADDCYYVASGFALWTKGEHSPYCSCREVPKTYAPHLTAQVIDARRAATGTGAVHESAVRQDAPETGSTHPHGGHNEGTH